jgi:hypothetical protein
MSSGEQRFGETTVVEGLALNGRAGALVQTDEGSWYYVGGLDSWDDALVMQRVSVTGVLRLREAGIPDEEPEGEHSTGLADDTLVLDDPSWSLASG